VVLKFGDSVPEEDGFSAREDLVAQFVGSEGLRGEGRDAGGDFGVCWRDPCATFQWN
jgi:hypothetical protein